MDKKYRLASAEEHPDLIENLTRFENELSKKLGRTVVLIAYTQQEAR